MNERITEAVAKFEEANHACKQALKDLILTVHKHQTTNAEVVDSIAYAKQVREPEARAYYARLRSLTHLSSTELDAIEIRPYLPRTTKKQTND